MKNIKGAIAYLDTIKNHKHRNYAESIFAYYRDYGTERKSQSRWPLYLESELPNTTTFRISNTIRHYMVGDCDIKGRLLA